MLKMSGVCCYYGKGQVLHGTSLEVREGELVGLVGRNGVGKTTTLKAIMGMIPARAGSIALFSYVNEHNSLWSTLLTGGAAGTIREEFLRQAREVAVSRAPSGDWLPAEMGVLFIVSGTIELLAWWLRQSDPLSIERIAEIHDRIVVSPVIAANIARRRRQSK